MMHHGGQTLAFPFDCADYMTPGIFITFEGSEGCGKSTQLEHLVHRLKNVNLDRTIVTLREPGGTPLGEEIRRLLKHTAPGWSVVPEAELLLFAASRAQLVRETIRPALASGNIVICDRFLDSTTVYQGVARRLEPASVTAINDFAAGTFRPDVTFLLDLPADLAMERARQREQVQHLGPDRMELEPPSFYEEVRAGYLRLAEVCADRFVIIDASLSIGEIGDRIWKHLIDRCHGLCPEHRA